MSLSIQNQIYI
jgi:hypothetical protein